MKHSVTVPQIFVGFLWARYYVSLEAGWHMLDRQSPPRPVPVTDVTTLTADVFRVFSHLNRVKIQMLFSRVPHAELAYKMNMFTASALMYRDG